MHSSVAALTLNSLPLDKTHACTMHTPMAAFMSTQIHTYRQQKYATFIWTSQTRPSWLYKFDEVQTEISHSCEPKKMSSKMKFYEILELIDSGIYIVL